MVVLVADDHLDDGFVGDERGSLAFLEWEGAEPTI